MRCHDGVAWKFLLAGVQTGMKGWRMFWFVGKHCICVKHREAFHRLSTALSGEDLGGRLLEKRKFWAAMVS